MWDIQIGNTNESHLEQEFYLGSSRYGEQPWRDLFANTFSNRNSAIPTPHVPFVFTGAIVPMVQADAEPISVDLEQLDLSFKIHIADLTADSYIFYHDNDHYLRLHSDGRLIYRHDGSNIGNSFTTLEAGGTYDMRIFVEDSQFKVLTNGSNNGPSNDISDALTSPSIFRISSIGGKVEGSTGYGLFNGRIWDVNLKPLNTGTPVAAFLGDFLESPAIQPWDDVSGAENHLVEVDIVPSP